MNIKLISAILAASVSTALSTTVSFTGSPASPRFIAFGTQLPIGNGNIIRVGTMTGNDPTTFTEFGTTTTGTIAGIDSRIFGGASGNNGGEDAGDAAFNNLPVYIWVYNAPTTGAATQQGIFRATANATPWTFPTDGGALDGVTLSIVGINQVIDAPSFSGAAILPANAANGWGNFPGLQLGAVPEPSTGILAMFGVGLIIRRRRK